jgi:hypothetical protein
MTGFPAASLPKRSAGKLFSLPSGIYGRTQAFDHKWICRAARSFFRDGEEIFPVFPRRQGKWH